MRLTRLLLIIVAVVVVTLAILLAGHLDWFKPVPVRNENAFTFRDGFENAGTFLISIRRISRAGTAGSWCRRRARTN